MQRPPVSDTSSPERKMPADSMWSREVRSSRGSTEHEYEVLLSFRGSCTGKDIAHHLYPILVDAGSTVPISLFREAEELPMGSRSSSQLLDAVGRSKISIPILSEAYSARKWCFREIFQMVDSRKSTGHGMEAFHLHKLRFDQSDVEAGQQALRGVSSLKGWESEKIANGHQGDYVRIVVETVLSELQQGFRVDVPQTLIGMDDRTEKIKGLLDSMRSIGIYGMGGIGKITLTCE